MKHTVGILCLVTALVGLYWSVYLTMAGLYGVPFSYWYLVVFIGGFTLLVGAVLWWTSTKAWTRWLPLVGSVLLAAYFVPAFIFLVYHKEGDLLRVAIVGLVIASMVVAVRMSPLNRGTRYVIRKNK